MLLELLDVFGSVRLHLGHPLHALILGPGEADLLAIVAALHAAIHIHVVVLNDPEDDVRGGDAFSALCGQKLPCFLDLCIDVLLSDAAVGKVVVRHIVDIVFVEEVKADYPGAWANNLIDPLAMSENVTSLLLRHDNFSLLSNSFLIT